MTKEPIADAYHSAAELTFVQSVARTMFVLQWGDYEEEAGRTYPGKDLMHVAPPTPGQFLREGWRFLGAVEALNTKSLHVLLYTAAFAETLTEDTSIENIDVDSFAHYLVMQAVGHGVSWFDSHAEFELRLPMWQLIDLDADAYPRAEPAET